MGSCDFTTNSYSFAEQPDDFTLAHFDTNATRDRTTLIPLIHRATQAAGAPLRLFGTPWSPPWWMKTNGNMNGTSDPCLKQDAQQRYHKAWALYFLKWIQTYEKYGVPIWSATSSTHRHTTPAERIPCTAAQRPHRCSSVRALIGG